MASSDSKVILDMKRGCVIDHEDLLWQRHFFFWRMICARAKYYIWKIHTWEMNRHSGEQKHAEGYKKAGLTVSIGVYHMKRKAGSGRFSSNCVLFACTLKYYRHRCPGSGVYCILCSSIKKENNKKNKQTKSTLDRSSSTLQPNSVVYRMVPK